MKIINITTKRFKAPLKKPFVTSLRRVSMLEDLIVIVELDNGLVGYGESVPTPAITGETFGSIVGYIKFIKPLIIGRDFEDFKSVLDILHNSIVKNNTAKSALEIALYDLQAKSKNMPLFRMLGGSKKDFLTDITISMGSIEEMVSSSLNAINLGYKSLKVKIGDSVDLDFERIIAIDSILQKDTTLRLDVNQGWTPKESVSLLKKLEQKDIIAEFIEQPIHYRDIEGLLYIKDRVQTPVLADEAIFDIYDAKRVLDMGAVDFVNIKLAKTGGIRGALELADLCHSYDTKCMIGCMLEGPISVTAGVHIASAKADIITMIDLDAVNLLASCSINTATTFDESHITLSEEIGLGVLFIN